MFGRAGSGPWLRSRPTLAASDIADLHCRPKDIVAKSKPRSLLSIARLNENGLVFMDSPQVDALLEIVEQHRQTARRLTPDEPEHQLGNILYNWAWLRFVF